MISQKAKYALRALLELARAGEGEALLITDIAEQQHIPKKFLEQILLDLRNRGLVHSRRGRGGGYSLLKDPREITLGQILRIVDGPQAPLPCLSRMAYRRCDDCEDETRCGIRRVFAEAYAATAQVLDTKTLYDTLMAENRTSDPVRALIA
ncbi:RrF2 family transcriptional regulator [Pedomonas mirosovicensis]|uniref:RrF2 family transcriptional regulator n=1 Tax=Pedomonas mirosovicensis TaxID=2908641 RepID=UPI002166F27B|nr:Rrf2 family transcriptional regulator [Pedomonas mirosovicensis]MCH8686096.1 Rrf2 family transcriptional regulator [Pedomonas mirosovicensis]